ncbi:hypothetical protein B0T20DRAFT_353592 [Sordaria brevicollis]|uniref:RING-type E3 ubiquitin transferase n=1 Tax=Sordaria brevicollis TaxID=83679 RepID=A0AAE0UC59_SORBR|nr:hypothetical protein B0T20DRAFT_353592 [Sordaria brevicollis]
MASPGGRGFPQRHLDATAGREVVYCYGCENEWYRDEYPHLDLECPRCHNDFVQIVEPDNDPRPNVQPQHHGPDSDPDEADIDEFLERGPGFFMHRTVYPPRSPFDRPSGSSGEGPDRPGARPDDPGEAVLSRFADMFVELGGTRPGQPGGGNVFGTQPRIQRTTFTRSGDGVASFTFTTTTTAGGGAAGEGPEVPPFDTYVRSRHGNPGIRRHTIIVVTNGRANTNGDGSLFRGLFSNMPPPGGEDPGGGGGPGQGAGGQRGGPPLGFAAGLQEFIATLLNPQAAVHGDAVYTQEALDRIITTLMEANPQSNAAPPATQAAIEKLPKKILDDQMVGPEGKAECTICIDDMHKGEEATVLPCKHWFHGECVTLWLKEHNTCPICRMPIEGGNNQTGGNNNNNNQPSDSRQEPSASSTSPFATSSAPGRNPFESLNPFGSASQSASERARRSEQEREERLERIRNVAGVRRTDSSQQTEGITRRTSHSPPSRENSYLNRSRVRDPSPPADRGISTAWQQNASGGGGGNNSQGNASSSRYGGLSSLWGRSNSNGGEGGGSSRRGEMEGGGQQQQQQQSSGSGNGALGWLRDHFGRGSGSGSGGGSGSGWGSDRDRERRR